MRTLLWVFVMAGLAGVVGCAQKERPKTEGGDPTLRLDLGGGVTLELVLIPAGKFLMGSPDNGKDREADEGPQHEVTISKPFYMGRYEVTQEQYEKVMASNPSSFKGPKNPVEKVSWDDAQEFCKKVSQLTGKRVRLPTEAEWEYACRAGTQTRFSFGDDYGELWKYGNYCEASCTLDFPFKDKDHRDGYDKTAPVGSFKPNGWGLYDMHGNVCEWCQDWYAGEYEAGAVTDPQGTAEGTGRVLRGGSWRRGPRSCRAARRYWSAPDCRDYHFGFRVLARTP